MCHKALSDMLTCVEAKNSAQTGIICSIFLQIKGKIIAN